MVGNTGVLVDRRCRVAVVVIYNFLWDCLIKNYGVVWGRGLCARFAGRGRLRRPSTVESSC